MKARSQLLGREELVRAGGGGDGGDGARQRPQRGSGASALRTTRFITSGDAL